MLYYRFSVLVLTCLTLNYVNSEYCQGGPTFATPAACKLIEYLRRFATWWGHTPVSSKCQDLKNTPHCCRDFCYPFITQDSDCDQTTGSCFCKGQGVPTTCSIFTRNDIPEFLTETDFGTCNCAGNGNCTEPAIAFDGLHKMCICYCP